MWTVHRSAESPFVTVHCGDCRDVMREMRDAEVKFDLIFADPPFNVGVRYDGGTADKMTWAAYENFTQNWLDLACCLLSNIGSLWVNVPDHCASMIDLHATRVLGLHRINWCIWHYRFGQCNSSKFISSKSHLFYFAKNASNRIWRPEEILVPSDRAAKYNDPRTQDTATPGKRVPLDVWEFPRVQGNNKERMQGHPNQLPERYLERVVRCASYPSSYVLDPFSGSGTTITVARALGRTAIGIELSEKYAKSGFDRAMRGAVRVKCATSPRK